MAPTTTETDALFQRFHRAETKLKDVTREANIARVEALTSGFRDVFPKHGTAVFSRALDESHAHLIQLIGLGDEPDIDTRDTASLERLDVEQRQLLGLADRIALRIGEDESLRTFFAAPVEEHEDWIEFDLDLTAAGAGR